MVVVLVLLTFVMFFLVGMLIRKEEQSYRDTEDKKRSPIFLSPDKALQPLNKEGPKYFHPSHTWTLEGGEDATFIGFDDFITFLSQTDLRISNFPPIGSKIFQGSKIWNINYGERKISQLAPVTGEVIDINPALTMDMKLPAADVEKSWILKIKPDNIENDVKNLMTGTQASLVNESFREKFVAMATQGNYLNDGGEIDTSSLQNMADDEWKKFIGVFFPYEK